MRQRPEIFGNLKKIILNLYRNYLIVIYTIHKNLNVNWILNWIVEKILITWQIESNKEITIFIVSISYLFPNIWFLRLRIKLRIK